MRRRTLLALLAGSVCVPALAANHGLIEPGLQIATGGKTAPRVALTLDACMGGVDHRILDVLVRERIPATLFVTGRWLSANAEALKTLLAHPDLFELENHGAMHVPAVLGNRRVYGIRPAGTLSAIRAEVSGGARAMAQAGTAPPVWYRDATALYSPDALKLISGMGYRVAGFSLNADFGASLPADRVAARIGAAKDGDVIIAHINQPHRASGAGVAAGILTLQARGFAFVRLGDVSEPDAIGPVQLL